MEDYKSTCTIQKKSSAVTVPRRTPFDLQTVILDLHISFLELTLLFQQSLTKHRPLTYSTCPGLVGWTTTPVNERRPIFRCKDKWSDIPL